MSARDALNRLAKWRQLLAGWQLGTRPISDPECQAVRDHREATLILRAEVTALTRLMLEKKIVTQAEVDAVVEDEARRLDASYSERFPGWESTDYGLAAVDLGKAAETTKGWKP